MKNGEVRYHRQTHCPPIWIVSASTILILLSAQSWDMLPVIFFYPIRR